MLVALDRNISDELSAEPEGVAWQRMRVRQSIDTVSNRPSFIHTHSLEHATTFDCAA